MLQIYVCTSMYSKYMCTKEKKMKIVPKINE